MENFPNINPWYTLTKSYATKTTINFYGGKREQRFNHTRNPRVKFTLNWDVLEEDDYQSIKNFFLARKGNFESFNWINPEDGRTYAVRFGESSSEFENFTHNLYRLKSVTFVEAI